MVRAVAFWEWVGHMDKRRCYRCGRVQPLAAFTRRVDDRHYNMCRPCVTEILTRRLIKRGRLPHTATERICYLCDRTLAVARFTRRSNGTYFSACKDCNRHVFAQRRRARLQGASGSYTRAEWEALRAEFDRCPRCRRAWSEIAPRTSGADVITADHIIPLARGGTNSIENIQPLCYSCNSQKGTRLEPRSGV